MFVSSDCVGARVRLVSLEMSIGLLQQLVLRDGLSFLHDGHLASVEGAREESTAQLRTFYKVAHKVNLKMIGDCSFVIVLNDSM